MDDANNAKELSAECGVQLRTRYHFPSHSIFAVDNEPISVCVAGDKLLVATVGHYVEVRKVENCGHVDHTFNTVDLVKQILYCKTGQYVATLEVKTSRQNLMTHVRLYLNWQTDTRGLPMRARIAGRVTPSSQSSVNQLEMVELPLPKQACYIGCCQSTGNLAISCGCSVSIFYFCIKVHDISKHQFHDLEHLMEVYITFPIKEVALCEDFLACVSANEVHVVRIDHRRTSNEDSWNEVDDEEFMRRRRQSFTSAAAKLSPRLSSTSSEPNADIVDDPDFISWNCGLAARQTWELTSGEYADVKKLKEKLHPDSWPLTIHLPSLQQQQSTYIDSSNVPVENLGPMEFFPGHPVKIEYTGVLSHNANGLSCEHHFEPVSLVHRRFPVPVLIVNNAHNFCLHSLQFMPLYITGELEDGETVENNLSANFSQMTLTGNENPFHSMRHRYLRQVDVLFSTQQEGFLYSLIGDVRMLALYKYRDVVYHVSADASILHAVTMSSIESYSLGGWDRLLCHFSHDFELEDLLSLSNSEQIKLIGQHSFFNIRHVAFGEGHLVLLTSTADNASSQEQSITRSGWTAYALQCPPAEYLYNDLLEDESAGYSVSDVRFLQHEALAVLAAEILLSKPPPSSRLAVLFQETCYKLANIYLQPSCQTANSVSTALAFYDISGGSFQTVMNDVLSLMSEDDGDSSSHSTNVLKLLNRIFINDRFVRVTELPKEMANTVLELFAKYDSLNLAPLVLKGILRGYDPEFAVKYVNLKLSSKKCNSEDIIVACLLCLHADFVTQVPIHLASLSNDDLIGITSKYANIWFQQGDNDFNFSSFLQIVQQLKPTIFVKILLQLISHRHVSVKIIKLLCQTDWEDLGLAPRTDSTLLHFLEQFLTNKCLKQWHCLEATAALTTLYLKCLTNLEPKGTLPSQNRPWILFGPRHSWLCELPPFNGQSMHNMCKLMKTEAEQLPVDNSDVNDCPCVACNDCLLRLQSLLCSPLSNIEVRYYIASAIMAASTLSGSLSLQVLCSPSASHAVMLLICQCPSALLEYCKDTFQQDVPQWQSLLNVAFTSLESMNEDDDNWATLSNVVSGTIYHLAEFVPPAQLVTMFPKDQSAKFLPQVRRSIAKLQANHLRDVIVAKGHELKALV